MPDSVEIGSVIAARYEVQGALGAGGMGMVFKAHDRVLDEVVAIKVLRYGADEALVRRFRQEVKLARKVRHRNVCAIHDYGEDAGLFYISMEFVEGTDLKQTVRERGGLLWEEAYDVVLQVAEGLAAIHDAGVIHRDLKPANVMRDGQGVVRVMDFGIARRGADEAGPVTRAGEVVGTPDYMSPEQVRGGGVDFRSDLYALGVMIFELFTGRRLFGGETRTGTMRKHLEELPTLDAAEGAASLPAALVPVLQRALAKDPAERHASCRDMLAALREARAALDGQTTDVINALQPAGDGQAASPGHARLLIPTLVRALRHADAAVRRGAAEALARTPDESARASLELALTDADPDVRASAREALRRLAND